VHDAAPGDAVLSTPPGCVEMSMKLLSSDGAGWIR